MPARSEKSSRLTDHILADGWASKKMPDAWAVDEVADNASRQDGLGRAGLGWVADVVADIVGCPCGNCRRINAENRHNNHGIYMYAVHCMA